MFLRRSAAVWRGGSIAVTRKVRGEWSGERDRSGSGGSGCSCVGRGRRSNGGRWGLTRVRRFFRALAATATATAVTVIILVVLVALACEWFSSPAPSLLLALIRVVLRQRGK